MSNHDLVNRRYDYTITDDTPSQPHDDLLDTIAVLDPAETPLMGLLNNNGRWTWTNYQAASATAFCVPTVTYDWTTYGNPTVPVAKSFIDQIRDLRREIDARLENGFIHEETKIELGVLHQNIGMLLEALNDPNRRRPQDSTQDGMST